MINESISDGGEGRRRRAVRTGMNEMEEQFREIEFLSREDGGGDGGCGCHVRLFQAVTLRSPSKTRDRLTNEVATTSCLAYMIAKKVFKSLF
jgi:hypothetical protein